MKSKCTFVLFLALAITAGAQPLKDKAFANSNSELDELNPVIAPDGKTLYITIASHPSNIGGKKDPGDIWFCTLGPDNLWSAPVHAGPLLNDRLFNGVAGFSSDGNEMYLLSHYSFNGVPVRTQGLSVARRSSGGWTTPENITVPYFQNKSNIVSGYIDEGRTAFVFSAETYGSYGVEDLFVSNRNPDGRWSEPRNLGAKINTSFQEVCPSLSSDGKTLYFSTNGRRGKGSFDIYSSTRLDDSWNNWSEPVNVASVNTEGRDLFYREHARQGFALYTSTVNSDGYGDVKVFIPETPFPKDSAVVAQPAEEQVSVVLQEVKKEEPTPYSVKVTGKVVNAKTSESVVSTLLFQPLQSGNAQSTAQSSKDGYMVVIPTGGQYHIIIEAPGYISAMEKLDVQTYQMRELEMNFNLQPIAVGTTVNLKEVLFEQSKTNLLPQSLPELDLVVSFLKANPAIRIELSGHTDNRGIPSINVQLSQGRVDKVKEYLVSKGIERRRITGKGYGGSRPVASNDTEETRRLNRRVEFTILRD